MQKMMVALALLVVGLAGCAEGTDATDDGPDLEVTSSTGGIRGVVIDESIIPIGDATVKLVGTEKSVVTGDDGVFTFTGLNPGTYFLDVQRPLYTGTQTSVEVLAGVADPPVLKVQITRIPGINPYVEGVQFDGYYECAFALTFITDSCDMAVRTAHDAGATMVPRNLQNNVNTLIHRFGGTTQTIIQEGFWDESATPKLWTMVDSTPIDNGCDCSEKTFVEAESGPPTYGRADKDGEGAWPEDGDDVAIRGFIPFTDGLTEAAYAINVEFQIFTHFFHSYMPPEGWNVSEQDNYPVPE